jgi:tetratricopeptide (TPR) repeat protein
MGQLFAEAAQDVASGQYAAAIEIYRSILALYPNSAEALSNLGVAYHLAGRIPEAVETLRKALKLDPTLVPANLILGIDSVRLNRPQDALGPLALVLKQRPGDRDALLAQASAYFALHEFEGAIRTYRTEVNFRPEDADAWYGLGISSEHIAEDTTRRMAALGPDSSYYLRLVGEFLTEQGAEIDAELAFRRALDSAESDDEGLHAALGFARLRLGVILQAQQDFETEVRRHPRNPEGRLGMAAAALEKSDYPTALDKLCEIRNADEDYLSRRLPFLIASLDEKTQNQATAYLKNSSQNPCPAVATLLQKELSSPGVMAGFERAFDTPPSSENAGSGSVETRGKAKPDGECLSLARKLPRLSVEEAARLAQCSFDSGRFLISEQAAERVLSRAPDNLAGLYWQAEASRKLAQAAFYKGVQLKPDSWQGNILLGDIFRQNKQWPEAIAHYNAAARLNPAGPAAYLGIATVHWQNGEFEQAETALKEVLRLDPENAQANFELGDIYVRRHRYEQAIPYLRKRIRQSPELLIAHADLGKALAGIGAVDEAISELTRGAAADRFGDIHYQLFTLYKAQGKTELAQRALATSERLRRLEMQNESSRLARAGEAAGEATRDRNPH